MRHEATRRTGHDDFGDPWFEAPLQAWCNDIYDSRNGIRSPKPLAELAVADLTRRLALKRYFGQHPEIEETEIPPILYVSGLPRSGTTLLHNLLSQDPRSRAFKKWEFSMPVPPPEAGTYATDPRIDIVQMAVDHQRGTPLERMHWVDANDPEECTLAAYDCTGILGRALMPLLPAWSDWIFSNDLRESYREYRRLIKLLLWRNPLPDGGYLVLKSPQNAHDLLRFASVFPEARFVLIHRDPFRSVVSACALVDHMTEQFARQSIFSSSGPGVSATIEFAERSMGGLLDMAESDVLAVHVLYEDLLDDPARVVSRIQKETGVGLDPSIATQIQYHLNAAVPKRARPLDSIPTYGIAADTFRSRALVERFCHRFKIPVETIRRTGLGG